MVLVVVVAAELGEHLAALTHTRCLGERDADRLKPVVVLSRLGGTEVMRSTFVPFQAVSASPLIISAIRSTASGSSSPSMISRDRAESGWRRSVVVKYLPAQYTPPPRRTSDPQCHSGSSPASVASANA